MRTETVIGGDLFRYALLYYGDATMWQLLAQANGLTDPVLSGTVNLQIPAPTPSASGGVYGTR